MTAKEAVETANGVNKFENIPFYRKVMFFIQAAAMKGSYHVVIEPPEDQWLYLVLHRLTELGFKIRFCNKPDDEIIKPVEKIENDFRSWIEVSW